MPDTERSPFTEVRRVLDEDRPYDLDEVSDRSGLPKQILVACFRALERAGRDGYGDADVEYARRLAEMLDLYPLDVVVRALRLRNRAITTLVVNDLATVRDHVIAPARGRGDDLETLAELLGRTASEVVPLVTSLLEHDYRDILRRLLDTEVVEAAATGEGREVEIAVGFVDVVGFTALSARTDPEGLDDVLAGFENLVTEAVEGRDGVLVAKFVGDAAMLVSEDTTTSVDALLQIVSDRTRLADAPRRAGVAAGKVLVREGDYFGDAVNLAARLTDHARPWSLLADESLEEALDGYDVSRIPKTELRGMGTRRPLRVRAAG